MDVSGFNGTEAEYHRLRAEAVASQTQSANANPKANDVVPKDEELLDIDNPKNFKQDVNVGLPASCDPPGPNNPPRQLVWIVSAHSRPLSIRCLHPCHASQNKAMLEIRIVREG